MGRLTKVQAEVLRKIRDGGPRVTFTPDEQTIIWWLVRGPSGLAGISISREGVVALAEYDAGRSALAREEGE